MQDKMNMNFPCLEDTIKKPSWCFNKPDNTEENDGWIKLCATDCNGNIQNIDNPSETCGCYLKNPNRHHQGKKINKGQNKKSKEKEYPVHPNSVFENVLLKTNDNRFNTAFERTNCVEETNSVFEITNSVEKTNSVFERTNSVEKTNYVFERTNSVEKTNTVFERTDSVFQRTNSVFDNTNTFLSKENSPLKDKNNKLGNSELSYFSDKNFYDLSSSKVVENDSEDGNSKKFTLFPEKSCSSPSILDGLSSYFKKNTPPRSRSLSDPQSVQKNPLPEEEFRDDSPDSGIIPISGFTPDSGFNLQGNSTDFVSSQISSLRKKIDELESEFRIKDETINESTELPNFLSDKHFHGANEKTSIEEEKTIASESFSPLYGLIPKRLFDCYSSQDQEGFIPPPENNLLFKKNETYLENQKANRPNTLDLGMNNSKLVVPYKTPDFYSLPANLYHSLNYPAMNRQPVCYNVDSVELSHEWINFLKKFESFSTRNDNKECKMDNTSLVTKGQGKKNYRKQNHNQQPQQQASTMECKFCKSNMESPKMYKSHNLKQRVGKRTLVTCPVLRKLVCVRCGETGDNAHTLSYCPRVIAESGKKPVSVAAELKKTRRVASGKMRKAF